MRSKTPLALMEQLVMVLVFALAAAMCVRMFVVSDRLSKRNEAVSYAAFLVQNTAEELKSGTLLLDRNIGETNSYWRCKENTWIRSFDKDWNPVTSEHKNIQEERYQLKIREEISEVPGLVKVQISVREREDVLFIIPVAWQEVCRDEEKE